jgi:hypothetical protein
MNGGGVGITIFRIFAQYGKKEEPLLGSKKNLSQTVTSQGLGYHWAGHRINRGNNMVEGQE